MRVSYIVALLMIVLIVGCAAPETPPAAPAEEPPTEEPPAVPAEVSEIPAATPETPVAVKSEIIVTSAGFDPAELTVKVGSTLAIKSTEGKHRLTVGGKLVPTVEEGSATDVTFDKVGKIIVFDLSTKKSAIITVTE